MTANRDPEYTPTNREKHQERRGLFAKHDKAHTDLAERSTRRSRFGVPMRELVTWEP